MWVVWKKVGIFDHYLGVSGQLLPNFETAQRFSSKAMADVMAQKHGGIVREILPDSAQSHEDQVKS